MRGEWVQHCFWMMVGLTFNSAHLSRQYPTHRSSIVIGEGGLESSMHQAHWGDLSVYNSHCIYSRGCSTLPIEPSLQRVSPSAFHLAVE